MSTISGLGGINRTWDTSQSGTARQAAHEARMFAQVDSDGSGGVDATELAALMAHTGTSGDSAELLKKMDGNNDGSLSPDELSQGVRQWMPPTSSTLEFAQSRGAANDEGDAFAALDTDADGQLSRAEFEAGSARQPRGPGGPPPGGGAAGAASATAGTGEVASTADDPLDTNHDGTVSPIERLAGQLQELAQSGATDGTTGVQADIAALAQKLYDQISTHWLQPASGSQGLHTTA